MKLEIAVQDVAGARIARDAGADRIELCSALELGGVTPSDGLLSEAVSAVGDAFPVHVLVRPRPGDFCYREEELAVALADVRRAVALGAHGVVIGALRRAGSSLEIDETAVRDLVAAAGQATVTFHRAIDLVTNIQAAVDQLARLGVQRVLTSGCASDAQTGIPVLRDLVAASTGRVEIMAGGGVRVDAIGQFEGAGVDAVHLSAKRVRQMLEGFALGSATESGTTSWFETDPDIVARAVAAVRHSI